MRPAARRGDAGPLTSAYTARVAQNLEIRSRRWNLAVLVVGTVAAVACAVGPLWLVRAGVAVALLTAACSVWLAWRQMNSLVREHLAEVAALREEHAREVRALTQAHHAETMTMIERFTARKAEFAAELAAARDEAAALRASLASSELDNEAKQVRIRALNLHVRHLEDEMAAVDEVITNLPRRGRRSVDVSKLPLVYPAVERKGA